MMFLHPWMLTLLVVPFLAVIWTWRRAGKRVALPVDFHASRRLRFWPTLVRLGETLPALAASVAIILLATPVRSGQPESRRKLTNIQVLLDCSGSMSRYYDEALQAFNDFIDARPGDAFGLSFFGTYCLHWTPITEDVSAVKCAGPFMDPQVRPSLFGGTRIGAALLETREQFEQRGEGDRVVILISDGMSGDLRNEMNRQVADEMNAKGIRVYLISIGNSGLNPDTTEICTLTGGAAFLADDNHGIEECFRQIDQMQKVEMQRLLPEKRDNFFAVALAGLGVVCSGILVSYGVRYTPW